jgi:K+-transporting ATPase ATPase A chain
MVRVLEGEIPNFLKWIGHLETLLYRILGINAQEAMTWRKYATALLSFNLAGIVILLGLLSFQSNLPLNPQNIGNLDFSTALNTAISFVTNTNWQTYSGENQLSYFSQMLGLGVQNFLSAATGIAVIAALARGLRQNQVSNLGNFWADLTRTTLYILLPFCFILALVLLSQGVVMSFKPYVLAHTLEGTTQTIPLGPAASQIAIKQLGTNGGGFFGVNSAHPFENPTPLTNFLEIFAMLFLPAACVDAFGRMTKAHKHAWAILGVMGLFLTATIGLALYAETHPSANLTTAGKNISMEGKETRHGVVSSVVWSQVTTATSTGATNAAQGAFSPITTGLACLNMLLGEIVFGGVGSGLYGMVMMITLTVFLAGLMVGRTPEYLGKKIEAHEVSAATIAVLLPCGLVLLGCVGSFSLEAGRSGIGSHGPHAITEVLYGWASMANNNGSAMGTLDASKPFYLWAGNLFMLLGRFGVILPVLYFAGSMSQKRLTPPSAGTFPTDGIIFCVLLAGMILIIAGLTYFPALTIGPFLEHLLTKSSVTF